MAKVAINLRISKELNDILNEIVCLSDDITKTEIIEKGAMNEAKKVLSNLKKENKL